MVKDVRVSFQTIKNIAWVAAGVLVVSLAITLVAVWSLVRGQLGLSTLLFKVVSPVTWTFSRATGRLVSSLEVWDEGVWLGKTAGKTWQELHQQEAISIDDQAAVLLRILPDVTAHTGRLVDHFQQSWLLARVVRQQPELAELLTTSHTLLEILDTSAVNRARYLVLLQNTDEVRATGGFIGSYTSLDFSQPNLLSLQLRDSYDPSGVSITLPSPPGQAEYLSEGNGMKLVDANWQPDFPMTAQQLLQYFEQIPNDPQVYDGVIAVPLSVIQEILSVIGGVYVADQQQIVTAAMFADLARQDRSQFFPGSQQKTQSLQSFYTALMLKLSQLSPAEWWRVGQTLLEDQLIQEVQLFAKDPALQAKSRLAQLDGAIASYGPGELFLFPVESNVGINKANRRVSRHLAVEYTSNKVLKVTTEFQNAFKVSERPAPVANSAYAAAPHLSYVNYYRLLVAPGMKMQRMLVNGADVPTWDEEVIVSSDGLPYIQLGFLAVIPEESTIEVMAFFGITETQPLKLLVQKQVGISYDSVVFSCFENYFHSPLFLTPNNRLYQGSCGEQVQ